jgi:hypothetical protein
MRRILKSDKAGRFARFSLLCGTQPVTYSDFANHTFHRGVALGWGSRSVKCRVGARAAPK